MTKRDEFEAGTPVFVTEGDETTTATVVSDHKGWVEVATEERTWKVCPGAVEAMPEVEDEEDEGGRGMSKTLNAYKDRYVPCLTARGTKSLNNGDAVAKLLEGLEPGLVASIADMALGEEPGYHAARYAKLNPGQIRMNSGNRLRAHAKKGDAEFGDVVAAAKAHGVTEEAEAA